MKLYKRFSLTLIASLSMFSSMLQAANPAEAKTIGRTIREMPELSSFPPITRKNGCWIHLVRKHQRQLHSVRSHRCSIQEVARGNCADTT